MKNKIIFSVVSGLAVIVISSCAGLFSDEFSNKQQFIAECSVPVFDKGAIIFDSVLVCGTNKVHPDKLKYASEVIAQWIDNDQDGVIDEPLVAKSLKDNKATIVLSKSGVGLATAIKMSDMGFSLQDLYASETNNPEQRDATQEETHHLVFDHGWAKVYPDVFNVQPTSTLYASWKRMNGLYYNYGDPTCGNQCKVTEYIYKATAAYLGSNADLADDEFTLKTRKDLRSNNEEMVQIIESNQYNYPKTLWPNGHYKFRDMNIQYLHTVTQ